MLNETETGKHKLFVTFLSLVSFQLGIIALPLAFSEYSVRYRLLKNSRVKCETRNFYYVGPYHCSWNSETSVQWQNRFHTKERLGAIQYVMITK